MPKERLSMRKIKEVLRLRWACGLSQRQIAESCSIARSTVGEYVLRAQAAGLSWPLPEDLDEAQLEAMLFPVREGREARGCPLPDWAEVHRELKRKGVTLSLLWMEYKAQHPGGYQYSRFCDLYREWAKTVDPCMRQDHKAGEKMFVDYCGLTVPVVDRATGETYQAQVFVAALGASNYTYAEATGSQSLPDWIGSHVRALTFFGGVPELIVPDNVKVGVSHACRYEPDLNPTFQEFAAHYETTVLPARVRKPKDKAKVEKAVQTVEQWILAPLRHRTFF
ncbi:MAG: IS21 family transposase, partial [bacterium]